MKKHITVMSVFLVYGVISLTVGLFGFIPAFEVFRPRETLRKEVVSLRLL